MKVTESTDEKGNILYYDIRTDAGTSLGSAFKNIDPIGDDPEITIEDTKKNATLWAAAPDLLEALEDVSNANIDWMSTRELISTFDKVEVAIKKARGHDIPRST